MAAVSKIDPSAAALYTAINGLRKYRQIDTPKRTEKKTRAGETTERTKE